MWPTPSQGIRPHVFLVFTSGTLLSPSDSHGSELSVRLYNPRNQPHAPVSADTEVEKASNRSLHFAPIVRLGLVLSGLLQIPRVALKLVFVRTICRHRYGHHQPDLAKAPAAAMRLVVAAGGSAAPLSGA